MTEREASHRGVPRSRNLERALMLLVLMGAAPAMALAFYFLWTEPFSPQIRYTLAGLIVAVCLGAAASAHRIAARALNLIANLLGALREGDYSIRGLHAEGGSATALIMREVNDLGSTLQRQRVEAVESTALLTHVMEEIDAAVFAFGPSSDLRLVNKAGELLLGRTRKDLAGAPASALGFDEYLDGESRRLVDRTFAGRRGRYEVRRATFYRDGRPHQLVVMADLSQALREEERAAWQRIVRVLSHEINNSLTPIKSIAHSVKRLIARGPDVPHREEIDQGLSLIEDRSGTLGRFLRAYAQLAKLPKPTPRPLRVDDLVRRVVILEERLPISVLPSPDVTIMADADQIEQLLINLVRNAVDAAGETAGGVAVSWTQGGRWLELAVEDEGPGLPETSNLFVPFFTTKPHGSGIGLALSRQIAEAHEGTITLENRSGAPGCRATLRLPLRH